VTDFIQQYPHGLILAMDQMSLYFQATLTRVWSPIGQPPIVRVSPSRDPIHFYGAFDVRAGREIAMTTPQETRLITANFLMILRLLFPSQPILLLLDRAPWHFGSDINQLLADHDRLHLLYFPPACPELNPQEHVWEQARQAIGHTHAYSRFPTLIDAFDTFLNETPFDICFAEKYAPPILCEV
jgi:putative transposase